MEAKPSLFTLYERDLWIRKSANTLSFSLLAVAGFNWFAPPSAHPTPTVDLTFEVEMVKWVTIGGFVLATLAAMVLLWRYLLVQRILANGVIVQGMVEDLEAIAWRSESNSSTTVKPSYSYSYYATLRYEIRGAEKRVWQKMPYSGSTFGLVKGQPTDLIVLEEKPSTPLIRAVYFKRF